MNEQKQNVGNHGIIIENRSKIGITGVTDVISFDDQTIILDTVMGELTIKGENIKVNSFAVETGNLSVEGTVVAVAYTGSASKKGLMSRLFG